MCSLHLLSGESMGSDPAPQCVDLLEGSEEGWVLTHVTLMDMGPTPGVVFV